MHDTPVWRKWRVGSEACNITPFGRVKVDDAHVCRCEDRCERCLSVCLCFWWAYCRKADNKWLFLGWLCISRSNLRSWTVFPLLSVCGHTFHFDAFISIWFDYRLTTNCFSPVTHQPLLFCSLCVQCVQSESVLQQ